MQERMEGQKSCLPKATQAVTIEAMIKTSLIFLSQDKTQHWQFLRFLYIFSIDDLEN